MLNILIFRIMKILCPFCLNKFNNSTAKLICRNTAGRCRYEATQQYAEYWGISPDSPSAQRPHIYDGGKSLFGGPPKLKNCPVCGDDNPFYVCPHCHNELPYDMVEHGTDIIPIIGGPAVGKTVYMVSLINQLNKYGYKLNLVSSIQSMFGSAAEEFKQMENQLFKDRQLLDKTIIKEKCAPWFIKIENKTENKKSRPTYLIFYDIAGEQFEDAKVMERKALPIYHASGAIVLLDTLDIPSIQSVRHQAGIIDNENHFSILDTFNSLVELSSEEKKRNVLTDIPIAFTFSKVDVVDHFRASLGAFGQAVDMKQNSNYTSTAYGLNNYRQNEFNGFLREVDQMDAGFREALRECDLEQLVGNNKWKEENVRLFGVSALGKEPEEDRTINTDRITPYRVLDPLIWILHKLGKLNIPK